MEGVNKRQAIQADRDIRFIVKGQLRFSVH